MEWAAVPGDDAPGFWAPMIRDENDDIHSPSEREIMELLFTETAMFLKAIKTLKGRHNDDVAFVSYLLHMLHLATTPWMEMH